MQTYRLVFFQIICTGLCILALLTGPAAGAQTQSDFENKLTEIYSNLSDEKKAKALAKELYDMVEQKKELQTYTNYYMLKNIFENQVPDKSLALACQEKAQKLANNMVGLVHAMVVDSTTPEMAWATYYLPRLFTNEDPALPDQAYAFLKKHEQLQTFSNINFAAYSFERSNDFKKAKESYEWALQFVTDEKKEHHSYMYYCNFCTRLGDYQKAEALISKMQQLANEADGFLKTAYQSEAMSAQVVFYLNIGDYQSYVQASNRNYNYFVDLWKKNPTPCDPYTGIRLVNAAFGKEMMKDYDEAEKLWKSRDSANTVWVNCYNSTYPNARYYPISMYPVFLIKRGKFNALPKSAAFFIKETEDHYNSYKQYADISAGFMKATQLAFLGSPDYAALFRDIMNTIKKTHDFRESTIPFSNYAYFRMRDKNFTESITTYQELFRMNVDWINDIIFTFGEKAFVTYFNTKLKEGYDNFHSFVKIATVSEPSLLEAAASQAFNNLLFTKSISLKGTQKRKEAFLKLNDAPVLRLYETWIEKKQQLIRQYMKSENPAQPDTSHRISEAILKEMQDEVNRLENELTAKAKDFKKLLKIIPPEWKEVQARLKENEAAVEIVRFQWRNQVYYSDTAYYAAYIITPRSRHPEVVYLSDAATELDNKFYKLYKSNIRFKIEDKDSYNRYWKTIQEKIPGVQKIYFSPDGIYHLLNISTLKNPATGKYVVDETEIHSVTSTGDLAMATTQKSLSSTAVLFGRPAYKTDAPPAAPVADENTRSFISSFRSNDISDLPGTEEEVMTIKDVLEKNTVRTEYYLKEKATEEKMYALHSPGILHIATHGYWSGAGDHATDGYRVFNAMVNSGLLLSGVVNYYSGSTYADTYDGILTAYEAQQIDLQHTSLVVLSACETTLGYLDAGEGVYGLQRAFRAAGAGSIMTSLWKVDDNATKDFMITFYQQLLQTKDKYKAFAAAQKITKEKYIHPYFWGAFIMVGE